MLVSYSLEPDQWLELKTTLKLRELVFIEVGVGYQVKHETPLLLSIILSSFLIPVQSLRLEFDNPPRCYTFQIGNEDNCRKFFDKLSCKLNQGLVYNTAFCSTVYVNKRYHSTVTVLS